MGLRQPRHKHSLNRDLLDTEQSDKVMHRSFWELCIP